jgi:hypothetical protein
LHQPQQRSHAVRDLHVAIRQMHAICMARATRINERQK